MTLPVTLILVAIVVALNGVRRVIWGGKSALSVRVALLVWLLLFTSGIAVWAWASR